jgi:hypothetical protein
MSIDAISDLEEACLEFPQFSIWQSVKSGWNKTTDAVQTFWEENKTKILETTKVVAIGAALTTAVILSGGAAAPTIFLGAAITGNQIAKLHTENIECEWEYSVISKNFHLEGPQLPHGRIGCIAGIGTEVCKNASYAKKIQKLMEGYHLDWTYNHSNTLAVDILETIALNYQGISYPAYLLIQSWEQFAIDYKEKPEAKYLQICFSQGTSHVRTALAYSPKSLRDRIIVLSLAPSEIVPKHLCHNSYNYVSERDYIYRSKIFGNPRDTQVEREELIKVTPHPKAPFFDHSFMGHTFREILNNHIKNFIYNNK